MKQKYYLRGLGFGILITALVFIFAGPSEPSEEEIIKYAESLGYVKEASSSINLKNLMSGTPEPTEALDITETPKPTEALDLTETPKPTEAPMLTSAPILTPTPELSELPTETPDKKVITATIVVERGNTATMVCNKMVEAGILEDGDALRKYLVEHNLTDYINIGTYSFSSEMSFKEIAKILTGRSQ